MSGSAKGGVGRRLRSLIGRALPEPVRAKIRGIAVPGGSLEGRDAGSVVASFRELLDGKQYAKARSQADRLFDDPNRTDVGALLRGLVAQRTQHSGLALREFDVVPNLAWTHAPIEYLSAMFRADRARAQATAESLLSGSDQFSAEFWLTMVGHLYGPGQGALVTRAHERAVAAASTDDAAMQRRLDWIRPWLAAEQNRSTPAAPGVVNFAVMDYRQPGPDGGASSRNIGDWAQTLASMGHLVRHQGLRFQGPDALVELANDLQRRVRPELRQHTVDADVRLSVLQRDASTYQEFPPDTWALIFGWFMHPLFNLTTFDFPLHPNVRPIFVSFHCAKKDLLSGEAVAYLRQHAPIGCRDWTTVDILLSLGIPAFFSGCLTTTIDAVFASQPKPAQRTLYVDSLRTPVPSGEANVRQSIPGVLSNTFEENVRAMLARLDGWRSDYTDVKTSRLHVYLPCRSVGLHVDYEPESYSDPRVNGLLPLSDEGFDAIRDGMRRRLEPVMDALLSGSSDVATVWQDVNADDVKFAQERHDRLREMQVDDDLLQAVRALRPNPIESATQVVYVPRDSEWAHLSQALQGILDQLPADGCVWVVGHAAGTLKRQDPRVRLIDTTDLPASSEPTERRNQLLASLPELLPADRVVLMPVAAAVNSDLATLVSLLPEGALLAARDSSSPLASGTQALFRVARSFDTDNTRANELLREFFRRHRFDPRWIDADVLVMNLRGMRDAGTSKHLLAAMHEFGLQWPHALVFEFGNAIASLDRRWACVPTRDPDETAHVWVWADSPKPWAGAYSSTKKWWERAT